MNGDVSAYPARDRSAWILAQRPARRVAPDPSVPHGVFRERERLASGEVADSGVVLLTNRECPWRCLMCDLWQGTTRDTVPEGAITRQVETAVRTWSALGPLPAQVKLYNSGSFFDPAAIPPADYAPVARRIAFARHVVVESHPLLIGDRTRALRDLLAGSLEVAMGLETAHPEVLEKLNKKFDLAQFARAAELLAAERIALRVFLLVHPPFLDEQAGAEWVVRSAEFAFTCGASAVTLIPTRTGNGAMDRLRDAGELVVPTIATLEAAQQAVLALGHGRVFADTWAMEPFSTCPACFADRRERLETMNRTQRFAPPVRCDACGCG
ncbi:MAG: radical SAM protein [Opitutaceae bacterium]|nr:radical SAM protein [Opitutaceae bacterium]